jgi:hypothetical protein
MITCFRRGFSIRVIIKRNLAYNKANMKTLDVYGTKKRSLIQLIPALGLYLAACLLLWARLALGYRYISYLFGIAILGAIYLTYLSVYEAFFRFRTFCKIEGQDVVAIISHVDCSTGQISPNVLATYTDEKGTTIQGRLYASFDRAFAKTYQDGDKLKVRLLKSKEFLLYAKQETKSPQKPAR